MLSVDSTPTLIHDEYVEGLQPSQEGGSGVTAIELARLTQEASESKNDEEAPAPAPALEMLETTARTPAEIAERALRVCQKHSPTFLESKLGAIPVCPTCQRPYLQTQVYFQLLQSASCGPQGNYYKLFFRELGRIGSGSYGTVYRVQHVLKSVRLGIYAIKIIAVGDSRSWLLRALSEVTVLEQMRHPNVVDYHHCWVEDYKAAVNSGPVPHLFILLSYCKGGSLLNLRRKVLGRPLTEDEFRMLLYQTASGLAHLHSIGFLSRDIKLGNILLDGTAPDTDPTELIEVVDPAGSDAVVPTRADKWARKYREIQFARDDALREQSRQLLYIRTVGISELQARLADFGQVGDGPSAGTDLYLAPELLWKRERLDGKIIVKPGENPETQAFSQKSDVYSLGISFLELIFDCNTFLSQIKRERGWSDEEALEYVQTHEHQKDLISFGKTIVDSLGYSQELSNLLQQMCAPNAEDRPTAAAVADSCYRMQHSVPVPVTRRDSGINATPHVSTQYVRPIPSTQRIEPLKYDATILRGKDVYPFKQPMTHHPKRRRLWRRRRPMDRWFALFLMLHGCFCMAMCGFFAVLILVLLRG
ncbi:Kinase, IKS [Giardia muris]|uniref:Kinase, IKS n=1 Tax=Giardia muris TaxID=5742 RepID=A0A4Z1SWB0_GIAMU|nr:Kinase, IKS [Giardia muris]|eukprot:TNJ29870.1 Kinase, IKS [Giardia muris]